MSKNEPTAAARESDKLDIGLEQITSHMEGNTQPSKPQLAILKSSLDELGLWETVKRFWKVRDYNAFKDTLLINFRRPCWSVI